MELCLLVSAFAMNTPAPKLPVGNVLVVETSLGDFEIELFPDKAPATVRNFLNYVEKRHYDGTIFHRVIPGFVVQGGGYDADFKERRTDAPIKCEADNGLKNERGTIAAARTNQPDSATCQFYINVKDNPFLDQPNAADKVGYCVFGRVVGDMEVVDEMLKVKTRPAPPERLPSRKRRHQIHPPQGGAALTVRVDGAWRKRSL